MTRIAPRTVVFVRCAALRSGCASGRQSRLNGLRGLDPAAAHPAIAAEPQRQLDAPCARGATALLTQDVDGAVAAWRREAVEAPTHLPRGAPGRGLA